MYLQLFLEFNCIIMNELCIDDFLANFLNGSVCKSSRLEDLRSVFRAPW